MERMVCQKLEGSQAPFPAFKVPYAYAKGQAMVCVNYREASKRGVVVTQAPNAAAIAPKNIHPLDIEWVRYSSGKVVELWQRQRKCRKGCSRAQR